ncbi:preprotein translocase subunit YajC [Clostridium fallax]|uniref:Protein translocase subunit yajC n=1 Tax=Clostridium fallax TaxID=1533 RepID=A0A1M4UBX0_9CLOT|nr:protein translocase subunit yajC [Clostridium fallax]SQB06175.1 preprotein translocase subunit YajC [Clostridium fallax]
MSMALLMQILPFVVILGVFYLFLILPEKKRRKKYEGMLDSLKVNDEVLTRGGIIGKIITIKDDYVVVESGPERARLKLSKQGISTVLTEEESK